MKNFLDWSAYETAGMGDAYADIPKDGGDFAKAVAVCINSRQCETKGKGVMCPSYRVSDDPLLATGGRVRLLKAALNGELGAQPWSDPELARAMELCLACKGCKRECENSVDMALIKTEYLAQRQATEGVPLRTRLFAHIPRWLHRWPLLGRLAVLHNRLPWLARLGERLTGVAARRLPQPAPRPFTAPALPAAADDAREVVLFVDTFSRHFEPAIAEAALAVLQTGGYRVIVAEPAAGDDEPKRPLCCGRSYLAHGMVEQARTEAARMLAALEPHVAAGRPIVGLEPSCVLSLRDDHLSLGLGDAAQAVAKQSMLFEEFLAKEHSAGRLNLPLKERPAEAPPLLVHGHCHQKAVGAMKSMRKVLKLMPGLRFELIESSCCGMGGSFGLEAEHAEISRAMAEEALLPALRAAPEAEVLANGFSCRHQIRDHGDARPRHLALLLAESLV